MTPLVLKLSDPKVRAVAGDIPVTQHWEVLRRSSTPLSAPQLAERCRTNLEVAQASLDQLVDSGFAVKLRATASTRCTTYRPSSTSIVIEWSRSSSEECEWIRCQRMRLIDIARTIADEARASKVIQSLALRWLHVHIAATLSIEESFEVLDVLTTASRAVEAIEQRAEARRRTNPPVPGEKPSRGYQISVEMQPLERHPLPFPQLLIWESATVAKWLSRSATAPDAVLTESEHAIARRLAAGESRPKIAAALGLSKHTVATFSKRIYAKLGVHSRAELAKRMSSV